VSFFTADAAWQLSFAQLISQSEAMPLSRSAKFDFESWEA
jgi:hypothetical protein